MTQPKYNHDELAFKIDHEGGIYEALRYGISPEDVPEGLRLKWEVLHILFTAFEEQWEKVSRELPDPGDIS